MLRVSRQPNGEPEIFHSLQGEGTQLGTPSVFLRLALCNLTCTWCDTKYTWDWGTYDYGSEVMELNPEQVIERIVAFDCRHLVVTGGEPLIQQSPLAALLEELKALGYTFEVETNGTIPPSDAMARVIDQWNVSPKLNNSGNSLTQREVPRALKAFTALATACFKFVVTGPEDLDEIKVLAARYNLNHQRILVMPEGRERETIEEKSQWLSQLCLEEGYRFTTRLHILLWSDVRGR